MSTKIEWTDAVWNPTTGCNKVSTGCKYCYAEVMHRRLIGMKMPGYERPFLDGAYPNHAALDRPLKWKKPRRVFVNSMSDLFHENVPFEYIDEVFAVMALTPQHTYQVLTKRPERMAEYLKTGRREIVRDAALRYPEYQLNRMGFSGVFWPLDNVWLGTSVENQKAADERIPHLLNCPAAVRFLSCEPLVGKVDLKRYLLIDCECKRYFYGEDGCITGEWILDADCNQHDCNGMIEGIHWVIAGGESGRGHRPMHPEWARGLRDQCAAAGVPFFFKQWGRYTPNRPAGHVVKVAVDINGKDVVTRYHPSLPTDATMYRPLRSTNTHDNVLDGRTHLEFPVTDNQNQTR